MTRFTLVSSSACSERSDKNYLRDIMAPGRRLPGGPIRLFEHHRILAPPNTTDGISAPMTLALTHAWEWQRHHRVTLCRPWILVPARNSSLIPCSALSPVIWSFHISCCCRRRRALANPLSCLAIRGCLHAAAVVRPAGLVTVLWRCWKAHTCQAQVQMHSTTHASAHSLSSGPHQ